MKAVEEFLFSFLSACNISVFGRRFEKELTQVYGQVRQAFVNFRSLSQYFSRGDCGGRYTVYLWGESVVDALSIQEWKVQNIYGQVRKDIHETSCRLATAPEE